MKAPDKIFLPRFVYEKWLYQTSDTDDETEVEYIRKDALLEWTTTNRDKLDVLSDNDAVRWGQRNAFQQMIDKLNSL